MNVQMDYPRYGDPYRGWDPYPGSSGSEPPPSGTPPTGTPSGGGAPSGPGRGGGQPWRRKVAVAVLAVVLAVSSGVAGAFAATGLTDRDSGATTTTGPVASATALSTGNSLASVAAAVQPSVVSILVTGITGQDEGSGVILKSNGVILTNDHVVSAAEPGGQITVKFSDGRTAGATVLGSDPAADIAVIQAHGVSGLKPATLGNSDDLKVGDAVLAVGSPLGLDGSVTAGIVSALNRNLSGGGSSVSLNDAIQTDAAINPGNSGGPLVNGAGQVVGINTAIASLSQGSGNIGVGFAIPINHVKQIVNQFT
jgi:putative serine protease PepD